jgi:hypothetical protein
MADRTELRATLRTRKPVVFIFDDGREWEFPPDIGADAFLDFIEEHGEELSKSETGNLSLPATVAFFEAVLGPERFADVRKDVGWQELTHLAWSLYFHYQGAAKDSAEDADNPPATAQPS